MTPIEQALHALKHARIAYEAWGNDTAKLEAAIAALEAMPQALTDEQIEKQRLDPSLSLAELIDLSEKTAFKAGLHYGKTAAHSPELQERMRAIDEAIRTTVARLAAQPAKIPREWREFAGDIADDTLLGGGLRNWAKLLLAGEPAAAQPEQAKPEARWLPENLLQRVLSALECGCLWTEGRATHGRMLSVTDEYRAFIIEHQAKPEDAMPSDLVSRRRVLLMLEGMGEQLDSKPETPGTMVLNKGCRMAIGTAMDRVKTLPSADELITFMGEPVAAQPLQAPEEPEEWAKMRALGWTIQNCRVCGSNASAMTQPLQAQPGAPDAITWPKERRVGRREDMSPKGTLIVGLDSDNDVYVAVASERYGDWQDAAVEFCNGGGGGGSSPRTRAALINLMTAIEADNADRPDKAFPPRSKT